MEHFLHNAPYIET